MNRNTNRFKIGSEFTTTKMFYNAWKNHLKIFRFCWQKCKQRRGGANEKKEMTGAESGKGMKPKMDGWKWTTINVHNSENDCCVRDAIRKCVVQH